MKYVKTTSYKALSLIFFLFSTGSAIIAAPSLIGFTIQFSKNSLLVPINVNYSGNQVTTTTHETSTPKITFEILKNSDQTHFDILVTPAKVEFQLKELPENVIMQNTVDYLKINPQEAYKYYSLDFIDDAWQITEQNLTATGQIPDRTLIIECYPEWIENFKGGSSLELPTLYLNNAMDELGTTQQDFEESLVKLELAALDSKIVHSPIRRKTRAIMDKKRVLIMDLIT